MELRRLKIDMDQKEREALRQSRLRAGGLNSPQAAETAERDFKTAQNLFQQAKTTLNLLEREANQPLTASAEGSAAPMEMNLYRILAPIEGVVSVVKVKPGELISSGSSGFSQEGALLLEIADQRRLEVMVNINEIDIPKVNPGMKAKVTLAARPGKPIPGKVDRVAVAPITDANKLVVYPVAITLPERPPELRQGMSASVDLTLESIASTLRIPVLAYIE
jgi:HlyD family secretion protein